MMHFLIHPAEESDLAQFGVPLDDEDALVLSDVDGSDRIAVALDYDAEALRCRALMIDPSAQIRYTV